MYNDYIISQGWQCPQCKRIYSPSTSECLYCGNQKLRYSSDSVMDTIKINNREFIEKHIEKQGDKL